MDAREIWMKLAEQAGIAIYSDNEETRDKRDWDIIVHNKELFQRVMRYGTLGLGEAYMDGWWDCDAIDTFICKAIRAKLDVRTTQNVSFMLEIAKARLLNLQTIRRAPDVAKLHYDSNTPLFETMLDPWMQYSCGYWHSGITPQCENASPQQPMQKAEEQTQPQQEAGQEQEIKQSAEENAAQETTLLSEPDAESQTPRQQMLHQQGSAAPKIPTTLAEAQLAKMEMICRKLQLQPGMKVLDIGCGFGGLARYMAQHYGVQAHGITLSREQLEYAENHRSGVDVQYTLLDYRNVMDKYDRIVSVGMLEHVGRKNYREFFDVVRRSLKPQGLALLHSIGTDTGTQGIDPWLEKYIFPNSVLPSLSGLAKEIERRFRMEDWHNFGADYDKTLLAWQHNFETGLAEKKFQCDEKTRRMYRYYLLSCAGAFRARSIQLWQVVLSPSGVEGGYCCRS